jgi:flagellar biosynthetic protein FliR
MSLVLTIFTIATFGGTTGYVLSSVPDFVFTLLKEALIGLALGFVVNLFITALVLAGEITDNQVGFSMAKSFDPGTGVNMPVFGNIWFYMFALYFFLADGHLAYVKLFHLSYEILPIGFDFSFNALATTNAIVMFYGTIMTLGCKLAMPYVAAQLIAEFAVGIIMKAVPSIQVFVINIQLKITLGMFLAMALVVPSTHYITYLLGIMKENLDGILHGFA